MNTARERRRLLIADSRDHGTAPVAAILRAAREAHHVEIVTCTEHAVEAVARRRPGTAQGHGSVRSKVVNTWFTTNSGFVER